MEVLTALGTFEVGDAGHKRV
ncbi:hypothetical protein SBA7_920008 [Candidatus Sulfotelmatobacter sp. SbA7]|nr:hypothetical protein SBA7_920008 [Candidatus Sulfotelmatobacter sp. SbA7]